MRDGLGSFVHAVHERAVVRPIESVPKAVATLLAQPNIDLVIYDIHGVGNGWHNCVAHLAAIQRDVSVAVISSWDSDNDVVSSIELGAAGFLSKTSSTDDLAWDVCQLLSGQIRVLDSDFMLPTTL